MTIQEAKDQAALNWWSEQGVIKADIVSYPYIALSNGVKTGNIKQRYLEDVWEHACIIYASQYIIVTSGYYYTIRPCVKCGGTNENYLTRGNTTELVCSNCQTVKSSSTLTIAGANTATAINYETKESL